MVSGVACTVKNPALGALVGTVILEHVTTVAAGVESTCCRVSTRRLGFETNAAMIAYGLS